ncbi:hypothetical protein D1872_253540 [compost metagenome]
MVQEQAADFQFHVLQLVSLRSMFTRLMQAIHLNHQHADLAFLESRAADPFHQHAYRLHRFQLGRVDFKHGDPPFKQTLIDGIQAGNRRFDGSPLEMPDMECDHFLHIVIGRKDVFA